MPVHRSAKENGRDAGRENPARDDSGSRLPGRDPQSPIVQYPAAVVKLFVPALPLHLANPSLRLRFAHLLDEGLPEHANPVLQPALALFKRRGRSKSDPPPHPKPCFSSNPAYSATLG